MDDCRDDTTALVLAGVIIFIAVIFSVLTLQAYAWWRVSRRENAWIKVILMLSLIIVSSKSFLEHYHQLIKVSNSPI